MYEPKYHSPGLFTHGLHVYDDRIEFTFDLYVSVPPLGNPTAIRRFLFRSYNPGGLRTYQAKQGVESSHGLMGGPAIHVPPFTDARLLTIPDSAPVSLTQRLLLYVNVFRTEMWDVTFEAGVSGFDLHGHWS
ncbi:hypothetical protein [Streptomyces sp.]|uniref:hypothetical protein n=1 Tax=Streptomyces sp. TaxID=1931 RepID=UPI002D2CF016|nr:hypothetical protein [Streptomyces sp.]HZF92055.1 hypothetical protein [Streptomyces sp.]